MSHRLTRDIIGDGPSVELVTAAARHFAVPVASIGMVGRKAVRLVAETGTTLHIVPREDSFSADAVLCDQPLVVEDTAADSHYCHHPSVIKRNLRFFAAAPLIDRNDYRLGAFCIMDRRPRRMTTDMIADLARFAVRAMARIEFLTEISQLTLYASGHQHDGTRGRDELIW